MNPRAEAFARLGGRYEVRVLEPSPPAVQDPPWFADDPVARGDAAAGRPLVSPVGNGDMRWDALAAKDRDLADWCAERWLGSYRRLGEPPPALASTRLALHRLAEHVVSPARRAANGKIGLRYTRGGFGTPFFAQDVQVRVTDGELAVVRDGAEQRAQIATLRAAAELTGADLLPDDGDVDDAPLEVDPRAAVFLGDWYGFATSVLEELRWELADLTAADPSRVQLWPEHFDMALELGREADGARAAYGFSPGDDQHPEPYVYVAPWEPPPEGELWQAAAFRGAELAYASLQDASDQRELVLGFLRTRFEALANAPER